MKPFTFIIIAAGVGLLSLTAGCGRSLQQRIEQAKGNVAEEQKAEEQAVQDAQLDYRDEWQAYLSDAEKQIAANEKSITALKTKIAATDDKLKAKIAADADALEKKNGDLKKRSDAYQDEGKVGWDAFKRDFTNDLNGLDKAVKDLNAANPK